MSKLEIRLNKDNFKPGEKVEGKLLLEVDKRLTTRNIQVEIYGREHTEVTRMRYNVATKTHMPVTYTENVEIIDESLSLIDKVRQYSLQDTGKKIVLTPGPYTMSFSFTLPEDATPNYEGEHAEVTYELSAYADIPWGFDLKAEKGICVVHGVAEKKEGKPVVMNEKSGGLLSPDIEMTVELNKKEFARGEHIEGKVAVTNKSGKKIRNIVLELYANEHAEAEGYTEDSTVMQYDLEIPVDQPDIDYFKQSFKLLVPSDVTPTLRRRYFDLEWYFKASLDIAKAVDLETETEIKVL